MKKRASDDLVDDDFLGQQISDHKSPPAEAIESELHDLVESMKPRYRSVISLHYWQGLNYADTARAMNAPVNSVRVWLKRAKEELKKELS